MVFVNHGPRALPRNSFMAVLVKLKVASAFHFVHVSMVMPMKVVLGLGPKVMKWMWKAPRQ